MARFHREENVTRRLDADESSGYAIARFVLKPGDRCWTPDGFRYCTRESTTIIVFERLAGLLTCRVIVDGDPYGNRKWSGAA